MKIKKIKIDDIQVADYNPRIIDDIELKKLENSIKTFGLVDPIIVNNNTNTVIGGHQRLKALKSMGYDKELNTINLGGISWIFGDNIKELSELDEKALNIALNKISGEWDNEKLSILLDEINLSEMDTKLTGFDDVEINELNNDYNPLGELMYKYKDDPSDSGALKRNYIVPPFSVLNCSDGDWQNIKKELYDKLVKQKGQTREDVMGYMGVSLFDPCLCLLIYKWFLPKYENNKVLDIMAGDMGRGIICEELGNTYKGIELRQEQCDINNSLLKNYPKNEYICDDAQNVLKHIEKNTQDMIISCPPYFDLEVYSDLENDASNQGNYNDFIKILEKSYVDSIKTLKDDRFAVIVASDIRDKNGFYYPFTDDIKKIFRQNNMPLYNDIILKRVIGTASLRANKTFRNRKVVRIHENVMVFYKGNPKNIQNNYQLECEKE